MARVPYVEPQTASADVKHIYEHRLGGRPAGVHKMMAHNPHALTPFIAFYAAVGKSLDRKLWEMVYMRVSFLNQCHYCSQHHMNASKRVGLRPEDWKAIKSGDISRFSEAEQAALKYAEKLTQQPASSITDTDIDALKQHFTDQQIVGAVVAQFESATRQLSGLADDYLVGFQQSRELDRNFLSPPRWTVDLGYLGNVGCHGDTHAAERLDPLCDGIHELHLLAEMLVIKKM